MKRKSVQKFLTVSMMAAQTGCAIALTTASAQEAVDLAVKNCKYYGNFKFVAVNPKAIEVRMTDKTIDSADQNRAFLCVMDKLSKISGASIGFLGNGTAATETSR